MHVGVFGIFLLNLNVGRDGGEWSPENPLGKNTRRPLNRPVLGPQKQPVWLLGEGKKNLSPLSTIEPCLFGLQSVAEFLSTDIWRLESTVMKKRKIL